eukprot:scaffold9496_cov135-Isochrysis_galbana.AAC.1
MAASVHAKPRTADMAKKRRSTKTRLGWGVGGTGTGATPLYWVGPSRNLLVRSGQVFWLLDGAPGGRGEVSPRG